jgi:hypothetical protein
MTLKPWNCSPSCLPNMAPIRHQLMAEPVRIDAATQVGAWSRHARVLLGLIARRIEDRHGPGCWMALTARPMASHHGAAATAHANHHWADSITLVDYMIIDRFHLFGSITVCVSAATLWSGFVIVAFVDRSVR